MGFFDKLKGKSKEPKIDSDKTQVEAANANLSSASEFAEIVNRFTTMTDQGKYDEAIDLMNSVRMRYPTESAIYDGLLGKAWGMKGIVLADSGKHKEAINCFDEAIKFSTGENQDIFKSRRGIAFAILGFNFYNNSDLRESVQCFDEAIKFDLKGAIEISDILSKKSQALFILGEYYKAIECCDESLKLNPQDAIAWLTKGSCLGKLGKHEEGLKCLDVAIELHPQGSYNWIAKSSIFEDMGKYNEVIECCDEALKLNPQEAYAFAIKGNALLMLGNTQGLDYITEALNIDPQNARALQIKAEIIAALDQQK